MVESLFNMYIKQVFLGLMVLMLLSCTVEPVAKFSPNDLTVDWQFVDMPPALKNEGHWELLEQHSDNFNYSGKNSTFHRKWFDNHIRGWKGPGATYFSAQHSDVKNGMLVLRSETVPLSAQGEVIHYGDFATKKTIHTGFVTAKEVIQYPVYIEAKLKVSKIALASNFWLLSDDDKYEIDVTETYGDTENNAMSMSTNYHIFKRDPVTNDYLEDYGHKPMHHKTKGHSLISENFHRFGFYWKSPTHMEFFLDGVKVRTLSVDTDLTDPDKHFFSRPLRVIFDMEDHVWRAEKGITPTANELNDPTKNSMYIDWIRTYRLH